ncbi:MAG: right-handed parallel beta-helix repeat-containing protein [Gemmataceae bacterium]
MASVRDFGARGDGRTDDTLAIRHALERAGGQVEFSRGDYRITASIEVPLARLGRIALSGQGGVGRVVMAGAGPAFRFTGSLARNADPRNIPGAVWEKERLPTVANLEIVGAHPQADGLEFHRTMQATLHGVLLRELRHGVRLVERNRNVLLDSCHIYNCAGVGVFFDRVNLHQAIIHGCHLSYCKQGGIKVVGSEIRNLHITGNDIEYNFDPLAKESADVWIDVTEGSVREGSLVSNTIQALRSPGGANVRLVGRDDVNKCGLWTITGNHISNQEVNIHLRGCRGITLTGNSLVMGHTRSMVLEHCQHVVVGHHSLDNNPDYKRTTIDGITLRDCDGCIVDGVIVDAAGPEAGGAALEVTRCRETSIVSCQILDPRHRGILVTDSRNTRIADCTILDRTHAGKVEASIEVTGKSPGTLIRGNLVMKGSRGDILAPGATLEGNHPAVSG